MSVPNDLFADVARYYSGKLRRYGPTPEGMDWRDAESQRIRFAQLVKLLGSADCSVIDLGCGVGALLDYLRSQGFTCAYHGVDVAADMIEAARQLHCAEVRADFIVGAEPAASADYAMASGIFNVRLHYCEAEWTTYCDRVIALLDRAGRRGFAFNCLTSYSDPERMRADLYYADPCRLFDLCRRRYSRHVALLHDYGLWEFTIIVRKPEAAADG